MWPHPYGSKVSFIYGSFGYVSAGVRGPCRKSCKPFKMYFSKSNKFNKNKTMRCNTKHIFPTITQIVFPYLNIDMHLNNCNFHTFIHEISKQIKKKKHENYIHL